MQSSKEEKEICMFLMPAHALKRRLKEETVMNVTKSYSLKGLDCPNCSAKIEKEVGELDGVQSSVVNLMKQTRLGLQFRH